jgi:hypothetical protein
MSSSAIDASVLGSYSLLEVIRVTDIESPSGFAMQQRVTSTSINGAARATMGNATNIPTSGTTFVSVVAKSIGSTNTIRPSVYTGGGWFVLLPLDGGSIYLTDRYRRFGLLCSMSTASGGPNPAFSMTHSGNTSDTITVTRWHSPQCEINSFATPFVNGTRSNTQAILDLTNNNTVTANSLTYASDGAFSFNGTSNFATIPTQVLLKTSATVSAWINIDDFTTGKSSTGRIFLRRAGSNFTSMISFYNNGFGFESNTNSTPHELAGRTTGNIVSSTISAGSWFNFALIFDNNNFYGYANGVLIGSGALSDNLTIDRIGDGTGLSTSYPAFFKGRIPTLTIYNRALSAAEVQQNFNALRSRYGI